MVFEQITIYGAGAIGGLIGARLAATTGRPVNAIARGRTLAALRRHEWRLREPDGTELVGPAYAVYEPAELGVQDLVVIAVKGPTLAHVSERIAPLLGPATVIVPAMNGVPWWFPAGVPALAAAPLESIDPGGRALAAMSLDRVVGCVVHASASQLEPGYVEQRPEPRLILGEPSGASTSRLAALVSLFEAAGIATRPTSEIRSEIWYKLWGNLTMNPVSALTGASCDRILADPLVRAFCTAAMGEAGAVGARIGCPIAQSPEDRHRITASLGAFRTSMLQDVQAGRPIELDAIVAVVREIAERLGIVTPNIDALLGLTRLFAQERGLYPPAAV